MYNNGVESECSVYVGNLNPTTSLSDMEDLIYELFLQAGPLEKVHIPYDKDTGKHRGYGFVEFMHKESVPYSINLMNGIHLLDRYIIVRTVTPRRSSSLNLSSSGIKQPVTGASSVSRMVDGDNPFFSPSKPITRLELTPRSSEESNGLLSFSQSPAVQSTPPLMSALSVHSTAPPPIFSRPPPPPPILSTPLFSVNHQVIPSLPPQPTPSQLLSLNPSPINPGFPPSPFFHDPRCIPLPPTPPPPLLPPPPPTPPPPHLPPPQSLFPPQVNGYDYEPNLLSQPFVPDSPHLSDELEPRMNFEPQTNFEPRMNFEPQTNFEPRMNFEPYEGNGQAIENGTMDGREGFHQSRIHANDHPIWLTNETREKLGLYHLEALEKSLNNLKQSLNNRQSY